MSTDPLFRHTRGASVSLTLEGSSRSTPKLMQHNLVSFRSFDEICGISADKRDTAQESLL